MADHGDNHSDNAGAPLMAQSHRALGGNEDADSHTCRFVHPEHGRRCGSPALRNEPFCYHHNEERPRPANPAERKRRRNTFDLAAPDSRTAIQDALGSIFLRIAQNDIDLRRAGLLLYTLQIASTNLTTAEKDHAAQAEQSQSTAAAQPSGPANQDARHDAGCPIHDVASSRHEWGSQPPSTDRAAIQDALGKLFPRIDDQQLEPRRAGLLLYCLQIASANLKAQQPHEPPQAHKTRRSHETPRMSHPSHVLSANGAKNPTSTTPPESNIPGHTTEETTPCHTTEEATPSHTTEDATNSQTTEGAQGFSPAKNPPPTRGFSPGPSADHATQAIAEDPIKGRPISRSTFATLLEALARRQGIDVEKLHDAHNAAIILRLHAVAEAPKYQRPIPSQMGR